MLQISTKSISFCTFAILFHITSILNNQILLFSLILFSAAFIGALGIFLFKNLSQYVKILLSFSGAYLFAITVLQLIPQAYAAGGYYTGLWVLVGFGIQIVLEQITGGVEHGHSHNTSTLSKFPLGMYIGLILHAFLEGMPLGSISSWVLLGGIALHHLPAGFVLASMLAGYKLSNPKILIYSAIFAIVSPLGMYLGLGFSHSLYFQSISPIITAVVIGVFLHIATTILFESGSGHHYKLNKAVAILSGVGLAVMAFIWL